MWLSQKLNYKIHSDIKDLEKVLPTITNKEISVFDTETTGLNFMKDRPFIIGFGFDNHLFYFEPTKENMLYAYQQFSAFDFLFAHNAKYDWHMLFNNGTRIPKEITLADGMTVARLTEFADDVDGIGLDDLGVKYVDETAKFGSKVIRKKLNEINKVRLKEVKGKLKEELKRLKCDLKAQEVVDAYKDKVQFFENPEMEYWINYVEANYTEPNYYDVYLEEPELMTMYMLDDLVILLEYLKKGLFALKAHYGGIPHIFYQECKLIAVVGEFERNGIKVDINYLLASRERLKTYIDKTYEDLWAITERKFSCNQNTVIKNFFAEKYDIFLKNTDVQALENLIKHPIMIVVNKQSGYDEALYIEEVLNFIWFERDENGEIVLDGYGDKPLMANRVVAEYGELNPEKQAVAREVSRLIIKLRTLNKWLSTYVDGMLNRVLDGRIHTSINNSGAVTGRVSCDMQQQPTEALLDDDGNELFHPRRVFVNDENHKTFYFDFSQMELRLQAEYTLRVSGGDKNLCRAYIPLGCESMFTGEKFVPGQDDWDSGEWLDESGNLWTKTDLHSETTMKAFPQISRDDEHFSHYRKLGKVANFLKVYGGGYQAIIDQLGVDEDTAKALDRGFYEAFPKVKDYQKWVESTLYRQGYSENIYGRRYYMSNPRFYYKIYNYIIQGGCADILKDKEIQISQLLNGTKSKILLPVHDELQVSIHDDEHHLIPQIKKIMDESNLMIPMLCDVEYTKTNWAEKGDYES